MPDWGRYWNQIPFRTRLVFLGFALTAMVLAMQGLGALGPLEAFLYDARARHCHRYAKAPTTQLVHLDIDDASIEAIGQVPWPRGVYAEVINELKDAGASAIGLDVTFEDSPPDPAAHSGGPATTLPTTLPTNEAALEAVAAAAAREQDAKLAAAVERFGRIVLAAGFSFDFGKESELERIIREQLRANLEFTPESLTEWLHKYGGRRMRDVSIDAVSEKLIVLRREVALEKMLIAPDVPVKDLVPRETHGGDVTTSPLLRMIAQQRQKAKAIRAMEKLFPREAPTDMPNLLVGIKEQPPLELLTEGVWKAKGSKATGQGGLIGSVAKTGGEQDVDGVVRGVPLLIVNRGHLLPQFGLALACMVLGVDPQNREEFAVSPDQIVLQPPNAQPITIPIYTHRSPQVPTVGAYFPIPWAGGSSWQTMYDWPRHERIVSHYPITLATVITEKRGYLSKNEENQHLAAKDIAGLRDWLGMPPADPAKSVIEVISDTLKDEQISEARKLSDEDRDPRIRAALRAADALTLIKTNAEALTKELDRARTKLREAVQGKTVIIGSTATGSDVVSTSLYPSCPGVVVHGAVFNAVMTRSFWSLAPSWIANVIAAVFGIVMTFSVSKLTPWGSTLVATALGAAYLGVDGFWLFDKNKVLLDAAAPISTLVIVWAGCTAANAGERFRIMQMLRGYIDPKLVEYLTEHSEKDLFQPRMAEMTVCFTDLQGFTTLAQELGEQTAPLISRYLSVMVGVIRRREGVVNKFLGDGIMFFFGAPDPDPLHSEHAVNTVLEMQLELARFNQTLKEEGLPELAMRCGVSTGNMVVGQAGPEDSREYTVLGDAVNLGARLEGANKACGTRILVTERTYLLTRNLFLYLPVGKLRVRGRSEGSMTYEPVCRVEDATEEQRQLADALQGMVLAFTQGVFDGCMNMVEAIEKKFGPQHSCGLYRNLCRQFKEDGVPENFRGEVFFG